jgi:predicted esterase
VNDGHDPGETPLLRHAVTEIHGRYLVHPAPSGESLHWLIGFHGQAQTAENFFPDLTRVPRGPTWLVAAIQGLNRYYAGRSRTIVANWMTSQDRELAIADNVAWVDHVLDALEREFGAPRSIVLAGFSQGVAMAYRAGLRCRKPCDAIVAVCGDVPPELKTDATRAWPRVLAATGVRDEWYTPARLAEDFEFLRTRRADAVRLVFDGGHEWNEALAAAAGRMLREVESA